MEVPHSVVISKVNVYSPALVNVTTGVSDERPEDVQPTLGNIVHWKVGASSAVRVSTHGKSVVEILEVFVKKTGVFTQISSTSTASCNRSNAATGRISTLI